MPLEGILPIGRRPQHSITMQAGFRIGRMETCSEESSLGVGNVLDLGFLYLRLIAEGHGSRGVIRQTDWPFATFPRV